MTSRAFLQQAFDALRQCEFTTPPAQRPIVKDAITALRSALAAPMPEPSDMVMVPREPTPEMIIEGSCAVKPGGFIEDIYAAMIAAAPAPVVREPIIDEMDAVASKYAHKLALDLECVLSDYNGRWWDAAMNTIGGYRSAMNAIHERESPTHMGEPVIAARKDGR